MKQQIHAVLLAAFSACAGLSGCAVFSPETKSSLGEVDQLLAEIESVQVECTVAKERSHLALGILQDLVRPDFDGDAATTFDGFLKAIEDSEHQSLKLTEGVDKMKESALEVFKVWTHDLEGIGNTRLRAQSHVRLEETRARYEAVVSSVTTAQVTLDALNADLRDHALFLGHDFNSSAVTAVRSEVLALAERSKELDQRLEACDTAARRYVESAALHGQLANPAPNADGTPPATTPKATGTTPKPTTETAPAKKPVVTLPPKADGQPANTEPTNGTPPKPH